MQALRLHGADGDQPRGHSQDHGSRAENRKKVHDDGNNAVYLYQFFYVRHLLESGLLGGIQFLRGSHYQDMSSWPSCWMWLPRMYYGTHAIAPMVALSGSRIQKVHAYGSRNHGGMADNAA